MTLSRFAFPTFGALVLALAMSSGASGGPGAKGHTHGDETAFGRPGDPRKKSRVVQIIARDGQGSMSYEPSLIAVKKGEQILFRITNRGVLEHETVIATLEENLAHAKEMEKNPDMEHDDPNAKRVKPNETAEILWRFTKAGEFDMSCLIPGHRQAGMTGKIIVK